LGKGGLGDLRLSARGGGHENTEGFDDRRGK